MGVTVMFHEEDAVPEGYIAEDVYTGEGYRIECIDPSGQSVADYISVNRSAMFRELKNLKEEGFIEVNGKRITLLYK